MGAALSKWTGDGAALHAGEGTACRQQERDVWPDNVPEVTALRGHWFLAGLMAVPSLLPMLGLGAAAAGGSGTQCSSTLIPSINQRLSEPLINKVMA